MDMADFYALQQLTAPLSTGRQGKLTVHDLGHLRLPSGKLGACDPFTSLEYPLVVRLTPGDYPVRVTVADVSPEQDGSHLREAYLSLVLSDAESVTVEAAPGPEGPPPPGHYFTVGVDAGTVAFVDAEAVLRCMPDPTTWYEELFDSDDPDSWFSLMDADGLYPAGTANIVMPLAPNGENVVLSHSGWGDGEYWLLQTKDAQGNLTGVHIDLAVAGKFDEEPGRKEPFPSAGVTDPKPQRKSWLAKLLGR
ncbi:DUF4241 domain-containing protein [Arthrobacter sp. SLBN-122]|uniref:DUF4241 domain-containing protein n=1 Tax=Arthrobacter sp. SLBN-122 TaxID=2768455 RepID=UPI00114F892E|nr:DUF4241 domain-containing protein [Arthrobacter sp. SLBN-122]TQJ36761.1 uncharacterized protein DUF4241 [Arthrobacter sp. SLBN-122]